MTIGIKRPLRYALAAGCAVLSLIPTIALAEGNPRISFDIPAEDLGRALTQVGQHSGKEIIFSADLTRGRRVTGVHGQMTVEQALEALLSGTGLTYVTTPTGAITLKVAAAEASTVDEVIVVGSRDGGRTNFNSLTPVTAFGKSQVDQSATISGEVGAVITAIVPSFEFPRFSNDGAADITRVGQLRGLKPDQTLVLINGKRAHTTAVYAIEGGNGVYTAPFDFNTLPTNAIGRIEVLADGAGAQYGSDAVAGVLNIVLDNKPTGGQVSASYGQRYTKFDPTNQTLSDGRTFSINADYGWMLGDKGFIRAGVELARRGATNRAGYTQDAAGVRGPIPFDANPYLPNSAQNTVVALAGRVMTAGDGKLEGGSAFFNAEYQLSDQWRGYAFGTAAYRDSEGAAFFRWPADWGGNGPDGNRNPGPVYPNGYRPLTHGTVKDIGLTGGASGALAGWDSDFSVTGGQSILDWGVDNSLNPSLGSASPKSFHLYGAKFTQITSNADFVRRFDVGLADALVVAGGVEHRYEKFITTAGDPASYQAGPLLQPVGAEAGPGVNPLDTSSLDRSVIGGYLDFATKLNDRLSVDLAGRYENYSDFGDTLNGKIAGRFELLPQLALRASASTNYRAPSLAQMGTQVSSQQLNASSTGLVTVLNAAPGGAVAKALGFDDLKPERSTNYSVGLTFAMGGLTASVDGYRIELEDALAQYPQISGASIQTYLLSKTGRTIQSVRLLENLSALTRTGYDIAVKYRFPAYGGKAAIGADFTSGKSKAGSNEFIVPSVLTELGFKPLPYQTPVSRFGATTKVIVNGTWSNDDWSVLLRGTRWDADHLAIRRTTNYQTLPAKWTADFDISRRLNDSVSMAIGAQNLFDTYPARQAYANTYFGGLPYSNSQMGFLGAYYYAKLKIILK